MKILIALVLFALALPASAEKKPDPNIVALAASAERQAQDARLHERKLSEDRAAASKVCAQRPDPMSCFSGMAFLELATKNSYGAERQNVVLPNYVPQKTGFQNFIDFTGVTLGGLTGLGNIFAGIKNTQTNADMTLGIAAINATRESTTVGHITGMGTVLATRPPSIQITEGGVYAGGDVNQTHVEGNYGDTETVTDVTTTLAGRDLVGRNTGIIGNNNDQRQDSLGPVVVTCTAGTGAPGGNGAPGGTVGTGATGTGTSTGGLGAPGGTGGAACVPAPPGGG